MLIRKKPEWVIDERTRAAGVRGIRLAREALKQAASGARLPR